MGDASDRGEIIPVEQKSKKGMLINSSLLSVTYYRSRVNTLPRFANQCNVLLR